MAEFNVLYEVYKAGSVIYQNIVRNTGYESEQVSKVIEGLRKKGWIVLRPSLPFRRRRHIIISEHKSKKPIRINRGYM